MDRPPKVAPQSDGGAGHVGLLRTTGAILLLALFWALASLGLLVVVAAFAGLLHGLPDAEIILTDFGPGSVKFGAGMGTIFGIGLRFFGRPGKHGLPDEGSVWRAMVFGSPFTAALLVFLSTRGRGLTVALAFDAWAVTTCVGICLGVVTLKVVTRGKSWPRLALSRQARVAATLPAADASVDKAPN